jgi:anti-sigma regulatory factor (Ser/Thr protein kinase)
VNAGHVLSQDFDIHCLSATRHALHAAILTAGLSPGRATTYLFAISEVLNNAIVHGGGGGLVTLSRQPNRLVTVVEDRRPTPPFQVPVQLPSADSEGGRGLWLATRACTSLEMEVGTTGLRVILTMQLAVDHDGPGSPSPSA